METDVDGEDVARISSVDSLHPRLMHCQGQQTAATTDTDGDDATRISLVQLLRGRLKHDQSQQAATTTAITTASARLQEAFTIAATRLQAQREAENEADYKSEDEHTPTEKHEDEGPRTLFDDDNLEASSFNLQVLLYDSDNDISDGQESLISDDNEDAIA